MISDLGAKKYQIAMFNQLTNLMEKRYSAIPPCKCLQAGYWFLGLKFTDFWGQNLTDISDFGTSILLVGDLWA